jgi:thiosulfate/3-mercaptopyruvate sulfurtransferase
VRSGHIPGSKNIPYAALFNEDGTYKPAADIKALFDAAGIDLAKPLVATCGSGITAAMLSLALARIGKDRVPVYDGSWTEWGGRQDTDVVTGAA